MASTMESLGRASNSMIFCPKFVLHSEQDPREKSALVDSIDQHLIKFDPESDKDLSDEIMGEGAFFFDPIQSHLDSIADRVINIDDKSLVGVAQKDRATISGWHNSPNGNFDGFGRHESEIGGYGTRAQAERVPYSRWNPNKLIPQSRACWSTAGRSRTMTFPASSAAARMPDSRMVSRVLSPKQGTSNR